MFLHLTSNSFQHWKLEICNEKTIRVNWLNRSKTLQISDLHLFLFPMWTFRIGLILNHAPINVTWTMTCNSSSIRIASELNSNEKIYWNLRHERAMKCTSNKRKISKKSTRLYSNVLPLRTSSCWLIQEIYIYICIYIYIYIYIKIYD